MTLPECLRRTSIARLVAVAGLLFAAWSPAAHAGNYSFTSDIPITLTGSGITLHIVAGSTADTLDVQATTLTVTVASNETLTLRYPSIAGDLANNGGLTSCNNVGGNNDVAVVGPATVTFTPSVSPACGGSVGGSSNAAITPSISLALPNGGETLDAATIYQTFWSAGGTGIQSIRLLLSIDGGATYPTTIASGEANDGFYSWSVPSGIKTTTAKIKAEAIGSGGAVLVSDASDGVFTIRDLPMTPATDIDADKDLQPPPEPPKCAAATLIKTSASAAVYYCGKDGKRYVFPDQWTYFSWYKDFSSVLTVTPTLMASIGIGGNATYKPGSLVKIQSDPKVYVVSKGGQLRWVTSEAIAISLFGAAWATMVHDVPVSFFMNYVIGEPITSA